MKVESKKEDPCFLLCSILLDSVLLRYSNISEPHHEYLCTEIRTGGGTHIFSQTHAPMPNGCRPT